MTVYFAGEPQYLLMLAPTAGKFGCKVVQSINGKRLDGGAAFPVAGRGVPGRVGRFAEGAGVVKRAGSAGVAPVVQNSKAGAYLPTRQFTPPSTPPV